MFQMRERLEEHFSNTIFEPQLKIDVSQKILSENKERTFMRHNYMLGVFIEDMILNIKLQGL